MWTSVIVFYLMVKAWLNLMAYDKVIEFIALFKASDCAWLKGEPNKEAVLTHVYYWIVSHFVGSLLKAFFYITDTSTYRNKIFYMRKFTWSKLQKATIKGWLKTKEEFRIFGLFAFDVIKLPSLSFWSGIGFEEKCLFTAISKKEVEEKVKTDALGVCYMRFLPKGTGLRPISNLSRKPPPASNKV